MTTQNPNNGNLLCFSNCPNQLNEEKKTPADLLNQPNAPDLAPLFEQLEQQAPPPKIPASDQGSLTTGNPLAFFGGSTDGLWNYY